MHSDVGPGVKYDPRGAVMLIYGHIRGQERGYGPATLTITGKAISGATRLRAVIALSSIMWGMLWEKAALVHFLILLAVSEHYMSSSVNTSHGCNLWVIIRFLLPSKGVLWHHAISQTGVSVKPWYRSSSPQSLLRRLPNNVTSTRW